MTGNVTKRDGHSFWLAFAIDSEKSAQFCNPKSYILPARVDFLRVLFRTLSCQYDVGTVVPFANHGLLTGDVDIGEEGLLVIFVSACGDCRTESSNV